MPQAPLRLIVSRELDVYTSHLGTPLLFGVVEHLVCGHSTTSLLWEYSDLINPYADNAQVRARRRRCRKCKRKYASV